MPRRKRSEKIAVAVKTQPWVRPPVVGTKVIAAFCPCCGRTIPEKRAIKIGRVTVDWVRYFDSIDWQPDKPFGVAFLAGGRGSFRDWEHIGPEDAPELFEAMKKRFIEALHEWQAKGWLTEEDLR